MTTTFGVKIKGYNDIIEVARRSNIGNGQMHIEIINPLVLLLPNHILLEALDNTPQGIICIGDLMTGGCAITENEEKFHSIQTFKKDFGELTDIKQYNHTLVQCPDAPDQIGQCIKHNCVHALPHEHTNECSNMCETVVHVIM